MATPQSRFEDLIMFKTRSASFVVIQTRLQTRIRITRAGGFLRLGGTSGVQPDLYYWSIDKAPI